MKNSPLSVSSLRWTGMTLMLSVVLGILSSCSSSGETELPDPKTLSQVTYSISHTGGTGEGTAASPAVATAETPAEITLSQQSTYNDPDGTVFTCQPKVNIHLSAKAASVRAKSLAELTTIKEKNASSSKGSNPLTKQTVQTFTLGEQTITFDLTHEVYTHVDSKQRTVEMPYLRPSTARQGQALAEETRASACVSTATPVVRLTPLSTRGSITTEQDYHVEVSFTVDVSSENTQEAQTQTLSFQVEYDATVETTTHYADPSTQFTYHADATHGSKSTKSPWTMSSGMKDMTIEWDQQATFTYFDVEQMSSLVVNRNPSATVSVQLAADTAWVENIEDLTKVTAVEPQIVEAGENPVTTTGKISFDIGGQVITADWSYDAFKEVKIGDYFVNWPYLKLDAPEVIDVAVTELENAKVPNKEAKLYEVTARIRQHLETKNVPESEQISQDVEYVIKYFAALEIKLVSVKYRKGYEWLAPHDNIMLCSRYIVYRDRTYSTGETFTDTFYSMNNPAVSYHTSPSPGGGGSYLTDYEWVAPDGAKFIYHKIYSDNDVDTWRTHCIESVKTGVPDLTKVRLGTPIDRSDYGLAWGDFNMYSDGEKYFDPENPKETWYFCDIARDGIQTVYGEYNNNGRWDKILRLYDVYIEYYDKFLYIDGQMITFEEYRPVYEMNVKEEDATMPDGSPAKVFTNEVKAKYLGRDFYAATIDTIYQYSTP